MSQFATEFLLNNVGNDTFVTQIIDWLRGVRDSRVLDFAEAGALIGDAVRWQAPGGETLDLKIHRSGGRWIASGCRHDIPDEGGRLWRTEAVLRALPGRGNLLRVRAQCLAVETMVRLEVPKRTHLIRMLAEADRIAADGHFTPRMKPHVLSHDEAGLAIAQDIIDGCASHNLPIVYVSAVGKGTWALDPGAISLLASGLCGVAHVVCEPNREFSFELRDRSYGENVYNGAIGIAPPGGGFVRRFYLGWAIQTPAELQRQVLVTATALRAEMPSAGGWDWFDLQEAILKEATRREQEAQERRRQSATDSKAMEALWQEELAQKDEELRLKDERLQELSEELRQTRATGSLTPETSASPGDFFKTLLPEIYAGEHSDRLRAALDFCLAKGPDAGLDARSLAVFGALRDAFPMSPGLDELCQELTRATRDGKKLNAALKALLSRHGFTHKADNKHSRMEPRPEFLGLQSITLMKTPGDRCGLDNLRSQIENNLGLTRLKKGR